MKKLHNKTIYSVVLVAILFCSFLVRLYRFDNPIADWHAWRQADTSAVSKNFSENGFDVLRPKYYDISNIQSGIDNPSGYRMVEFPLYNFFQAVLFKSIGIFTIEEWGRLVTIFSSTITTYLLYVLVARYSKAEIGLFAAFFYAFIPYNIFYGRVILPDPTMVAAIMAGIYFFDKWIEEKSKVKSQKSEVLFRQAQDPESIEGQIKIRNYAFYFLGIIFTAAALLLKPYALFFTLPMIYIAYKKLGLRFFTRWELYVFAVLSLFPFVAWRQWITQFPEGVASNLWLLNGNGIRFRPAFFKWIIYERITKLILGYSGLVFPMLGVLTITMQKTPGFFLSFAVASILYVVIFATGNVQHDYYQILIMPTIAMFCALGAYFLWSFRKPVGQVLLIVIIGVMFYFSWMDVRDYFNINNIAVVTAGVKADQILPKDALVIAPYGGDTTLLYHINRRGWPAFQDSLENLVKKGASYIVLVNPTSSDVASYRAQYDSVASSSSYIIFKLQ